MNGGVGGRWFAGRGTESRSLATSMPLWYETGSGEPMFVALSRFVVANGMTDAVKYAFLERPHLVERARGFVRLDVWNPIDAPDEIWLVTYWTDEDSYRSWHDSDLHRESHARIPKGLKLVPGSFDLRFFEHVAS